MRDFQVSVIMQQVVEADTSNEAQHRVCDPIREAFGGGDTVGIIDIAVHELHDPVPAPAVDSDVLLKTLPGPPDEVAQMVYLMRQRHPAWEVPRLIKLARDTMEFLATSTT